MCFPCGALLDATFVPAAPLFAVARPPCDEMFLVWYNAEFEYSPSESSALLESYADLDLQLQKKQNLVFNSIKIK